MSLKFCPKCGNKLEPDASFCNTCGADVKVRETTVQISTTQTIKSSQTPLAQPETVIYANFLKRLIALFFDSIIIGAIGSVFSWFLFASWLPINILDPLGGFWYSVPFDFIFGFLYHWGLETYNKGQTLGKMALNIRTVDEKTLKLASSSHYAVNNLLKGSPLLILDFLIGYLKNSGDPKNRIRILQNVSETVVIFTKEKF